MDKSQKSSEIPLDLALIMVTMVSSDLFSGSMKSNSIFVMSSPALSPVFIACASVHAIYKSWGRPGGGGGGGLCYYVLYGKPISTGGYSNCGIDLHRA